MDWARINVVYLLPGAYRRLGEETAFSRAKKRLKVPRGMSIFGPLTPRLDGRIFGRSVLYVVGSTADKEALPSKRKRPSYWINLDDVPAGGERWELGEMRPKEWEASRL